MKKPFFIITQARILHLVTAFIIVPISGFLAAWTAKHFPGLPNFSKNEIEAVFIAGSSSGLAIGIHFLRGWQLWERTIGRVIDVEPTAASKVTGV